MKESQPILPGFEAIRTLTVIKERKPSQPRPGPERPLNGWELLYHPLTLRFRGEINRWLGRINFSPDEVLKEQEEKMVKLYLWPQEGKWLSLREVAAQIGWPEQKERRVSYGIKFALLKIWRREENGPQVIEKLKLPWYLYFSLVKAGISVMPEIQAIDDEKKIRKICGSESNLKVLKEALVREGLQWHPLVEFPLFS